MPRSVVLIKKQTVIGLEYELFPIPAIVPCTSISSKWSQRNAESKVTSDSCSKISTGTL
jgi:hypothetical protein